LKVRNPDKEKAENIIVELQNEPITFEYSLKITKGSWPKHVSILTTLAKTVPTLNEEN